MNIQEHKNKIKSLSVCSIPVMLAVAGWSVGSSPTDIATVQTHCESLPTTAKSTTHAGKFHHVSAQSEATWLCVSPDKDYFWVSQGADASISIYRFTDEFGNYELVEQTSATEFDDLLVSAAASGSVDLLLSDDGDYLHQVFTDTGTVGVYEIENGSLALVEVLAV